MVCGFSTRFKFIPKAKEVLDEIFIRVSIRVANILRCRLLARMMVEAAKG